MTLTGPTSAVANETVRVEGRLTLDGREPGRRVELALMRLATAPDGNRWTIMPDIQTAEDGSFSFTDEVPGVGSYRYFVVWNGDSGYASARAEHSIEVASRRAEWQVAPSIDGEVDRPYSVGGMLVFDSGPCSGPQVIHVRRQAGTESPERLPDVTTDDGCYFAFTDRHGSAGEVKYSLWWDGDAGHDGASAEVTARVDLAGTYFFFHTAAVTLPWSGRKGVIRGPVAGRVHRDADSRRAGLRRPTGRPERQDCPAPLARDGRRRNLHHQGPPAEERDQGRAQVRVRGFLRGDPEVVRRGRGPDLLRQRPLGPVAMTAAYRCCVAARL